MNFSFRDHELSDNEKTGYLMGAIGMCFVGTPNWGIKEVYKTFQQKVRIFDISTGDPDPVTGPCIQAFAALTSDDKGDLTIRHISLYKSSKLLLDDVVDTFIKYIKGNHTLLSTKDLNRIIVFCPPHPTMESYRKVVESNGFKKLNDSNYFLNVFHYNQPCPTQAFEKSFVKITQCDTTLTQTLPSTKMSELLKCQDLHSIAYEFVDFLLNNQIILESEIERSHVQVLSVLGNKTLVQEYEIFDEHEKHFSVCSSSISFISTPINTVSFPNIIDNNDMVTFGPGSVVKSFDNSIRLNHEPCFRIVVSILKENDVLTDNRFCSIN